MKMSIQRAVNHTIHSFAITQGFVCTFYVILLQPTVGKHVFPTHCENVLTSKSRAYLSALEQCNHEEVDTLIMIHVLDASLHGHRRIKIRGNDTGFVVLGVSNDPTLTLDEL